MKKIVVFLGLLTVFEMSLCQNKETILDSAYRWQIIDNYQILFGGEMECYEITFGGDTLIKDKIYKKILKQNGEVVKIRENIGFMRKDSLLGYIYLDHLQNQGVVYNFEAEPGDTIQIQNPYLHILNPINAKVITKNDTILNNVTYEKIVLMNIENGLEEIWIEAMGSTRGILNSGFDLLGLTGVNPFLLSIIKNDTIIYHNQEFDTCQCNTETNSKFLSKTFDISVYPNPVSDYITLILYQNTRGLIFNIYSILGTKISETKICNRVSKIPVSNFNEGTYLYSIEYKKSIIKKDILLIKN